MWLLHGGITKYTKAASLALYRKFTAYPCTERDHSAASYVAVTRISTWQYLKIHIACCFMSSIRDILRLQRHKISMSYMVLGALKRTNVTDGSQNQVWKHRITGNWNGRKFPTHLIHRTLHLQSSVYFAIFKIALTEKQCETSV